MINKQFKIILVFIVFFGLISFPFFTDNVKATLEYPYGFYGFENTIATYQVTSSESEFFTTYNVSDAQQTHVDTTYAHEGTKSYRIHDNGVAIGWAYWNCTLNENANDISNVSWWVYIDEILTGDMAKFYMYNNNDTLLWNVVLSGTVLQYVDHNGVDQTIRNNIPEDEWFKIWVQYNTIDSVDYGCEEIGVAPGQSIISGVQPRNVVTEPTFKQFKLWVNSQPSAEQYWVDNFNVTFGDINFTAPTQDDDFVDYCITGDYTSEFWKFSNNANLLTYYHEDILNIRLDKTIRRIDYLISPQQYDKQQNPSRYAVVINGNYYTFTSIIPYEIKIHALGGGGFESAYMLSRDIELNVDAFSYITFAFAYYINVGGEYVVQKWTSVYNGFFIHRDGNVRIKVHNSDNYFLDNKFNGALKGDFNFPFRIFYDCDEEFIHPDECQEDNLNIRLSKNNTYYYYVGEGVLWDITFNYDYVASDNIISLNHNGTSYPFNGIITYPYTMIDCKESKYFIPITSGSYNITLSRSGVILHSKNFTVDYPPSWNTYYVWTVPPSTKSGNPVRINYRFFNPDGYDGYLIVTRDININNKQSYVQVFSVENNDTGFFDTNFMDIGNYYIYLVYNNIINYTKYLHIHTVEEYNENSIYRVFSSVIMGDLQTVHYSHDKVGWEVVIKKNGGIIKDVSSSGNGQFSFVQLTTGSNINLTLEYKRDGEWYILAIAEPYSVVYSDTDIDYTYNEYAKMVDEYLNNGQQFILGFAIIGIAMFLPLYINHEWNKNFSVTFEVPPFVYVVFIIIGFAFDIYLELFDMWTLVLLTFVIICAVVWQLLSGGYLSRLGIRNKGDGNE